MHRVAGTLLAALLLVGCNDDGPRPVVSLDQALQATAQLSGQGATVGFVPPPRTISDITAILDQQKPDPKKAAANRAIADRIPPAGATAAQLTPFFYERGTAARALGRNQQSVADFREAVRNAHEARLSARDYSRSLQQLASAELTIGNPQNALAAVEEWIANIDLIREPGEKLGALAMLAGSQAQAGNLEAAEQSFVTTQAYFKGLSRFVSSEAYYALVENWRSGLERTRAILAAARGRYAEAEVAIRAAIRDSDITLSKSDQIQRHTNNPLGAVTRRNDRIGLSLLLADILQKQGRLIEAEAEARRGLLDALKNSSRESLLTGAAVRTLASIIGGQGRLAEAQQLTLAALRIFQAAGADGTSPAIAGTLRQVAQNQALSGDWKGSLETYGELRQGLGGDQDARDRYLDGDPFYALTLVQNGRASSALPILEKVVARDLSTFGERSYNTAETRGFYGVALASARERDHALAEFRAAIPVLLQRSRAAEDGAISAAARDLRLQMILESYIGVLATSPADADAAAESFRLADAARGRAVQRALTASAARGSAGNPALADLARREQDAQMQGAALQGLLTNLLASPSDQQDASALQQLRTQIDQLRTARAAMRQEMESRFPDYANLIDPPPATIEQARAAMRPGEALIATYVGAAGTFVWAVSKTGPVAFTAVEMGEAQVDEAVGRLRRALDPNVATLGDIPAFDVRLAHRLYAALLAPVESGWKGARSLLVVPHKALGQVPLALMVTAPHELAPDRGAMFSSYKRVPFLVRDVAVTQLPSVTSLATLRALPAGNAGRRAFAGFGDPWFNLAQAAEAKAEAAGAAPIQTALATRGLPLVRRSVLETTKLDSAELARLPRLRDTADEIRSIAAALGADLAKDVFLGAAANERQIRTMTLSDRKVILFATHGLVPGDVDGLTQPALALSAPSVANVEGDGLLTMDKILGLRLDADWVVLSACNTAAGNGAGSEAVSGLGRAFFYAGTRALLVSNWPVETNSARALTTDLFRRQAEQPGLSRTEALRQAELGLIDGPGHVVDGKSLFAYAHPIFWAPFAVIGDGSGQRD